MSEELNVLGEPLLPCSHDPLTGFQRDGCCSAHPQDLGDHLVCTLVTKEFLDFCVARGNDLVTPVPDYGFPGLRPGDRWCLCAARWQEAFEAGAAPKVVLTATHQNALDTIELGDLKQYAVDLN